MRATIIADDSAVYVEGQALAVSLTGLDPTIHAVQWYGTTGEVEYKAASDGTRAPNLVISDFTPYQPFVDLWTTAQATAVAAAAALAVAEVAAATKSGAGANVIAN